MEINAGFRHRVYHLYQIQKIIRSFHHSCLHLRSVASEVNITIPFKPLCNLAIRSFLFTFSCPHFKTLYSCWGSPVWCEWVSILIAHLFARARTLFSGASWILHCLRWGKPPASGSVVLSLTCSRCFLGVGVGHVVYVVAVTTWMLPVLQLTVTWSSNVKIGFGLRTPKRFPSSLHKVEHDLNRDNECVELRWNSADICSPNTWVLYILLPQ